MLAYFAHHQSILTLNNPRQPKPPTTLASRRRRYWLGCSPRYKLPQLHWTACADESHERCDALAISLFLFWDLRAWPENGGSWVDTISREEAWKIRKIIAGNKKALLILRGSDRKMLAELCSITICLRPVLTSRE